MRALNVYIRGIGAVSIQQPLSVAGVFDPLAYNTPQVRCIEPDFRQFIEPMAARRMSPIIKRAIVSSMWAMKEAGEFMPDAILSGTGLGCVEDTERFLGAMVREGEECLHPAFFIHSTHNTINSQIAIRIKCHGYNNTHVHRGISFESALQEAGLLFANKRIRSALVGGHEELTPTYFNLLGKLGYWREEEINSLQIVQTPGKGTFAGEGSIAFMLSQEQDGKAYARLESVEIGYGSVDLKQEAFLFLKRYGIDPGEVDVIMTGKNGDVQNDCLYDGPGKWPGREEMVYKPLCGEFFTATAYGVFVGCVCLQSGIVPAHLTLSGQEVKGVRRLLVVNHWQGKEYSFILLSSCGN